MYCSRSPVQNLRNEHPLNVGTAPALTFLNRRFRVARPPRCCDNIQMKQQSLAPRAWAELFLLALLWGGSFLSFAIALREIGVFTLVAHRVAWAALLLWIYAAWAGIPIPRGARVWAACFVMGLLNNVIPFGLIAWGQTEIESGLASILNATTAFFGIVIAALVFADERLTRRKIIGTMLGILGVAVTMGFDALAGFDPRSLAQIAILGAAISYGLAGSWARKTLSDLRPEAAALGMLTGSTAIILPLAFVIDGMPTLVLLPETLISIGYISIGATAGAYLLYYRVLAQAGSGNLMLVTILITPIAILLGALVLGEALPAQAFFGFAILALGLIVIDGRLLRAR